MSYDIVYNRIIIKIDDNLYLPIIQSGANNCWIINRNGKSIPEKSWCNIALNSHKPFVDDKELMKLCSDYETYGLYKSRHSAFKAGEFTEFIMSGLRYSKSVEFWAEQGYKLNVVHYNNSNDTTPSRQDIDNTDDLINAIGNMSPESIFYIGFSSRNVCVKKQPNKKVNNDKAVYFLVDEWNDKNVTCFTKAINRKGRCHIYSTTFSINDSVTHKHALEIAKLFKTSAECETYISKYNNFNCSIMMYYNGVFTPIK